MIEARKVMLARENAILSQREISKTENYFTVSRELRDLSRGQLLHPQIQC